MEKVVVTRRFRRNVLSVYQYLSKDYSARIADEFLEKVEQRIAFIITNPTIGKPSLTKANIRSVILTPYNQIFYRYTEGTAEILCLFDMRRHPGKKPY